MNHEELQHHLDTLKTPTSINYTHKRQLKHVLMHQASSSGFKNLFLTFHHMSLIKKIAPFGVVAVIAIVVVVANVLPTSLAPQAHAQELVNQSIERVITIPAQTREEIEKNIHADMQETLDEAKHASDLRIITKEELDHENAQEVKNGTYQVFLEKIALDDADMSSILEPATYLRYTNPQNQEVTIGLDKNEVLVFKLIKFAEAEGMKFMEDALLHSDTPGGPVKVEVNK